LGGRERRRREARGGGATTVVADTIKELMFYPKCRSVKVINNPGRPGSNHREVNCINYN